MGLVLVGQLGEGLGQPARLLADGHNLADQRREELADLGQGLAQAVAPLDGVEHGFDPRAEAEPVRPLDFALPDAADVDAGVQRHGHPAAQAGEMPDGDPSQCQT